MPGKVKVKVLAGRNLPVMDRGSDTTDAYVEIKLGNTTHKTDVCRKSLNPHWNSDWYRFEVDDAELQDEPLQIRLMDYDTYSANDAIGKVYISLNPLLLPTLDKQTSHAGKGSVMSGWIPVYDTMHGVRGEVNVIVKVDLFSDVNKFRQSSCGVKFFHSPNIPHGYHAQIIHGFVEELVVNDDPEYQWIDKIRTPRASNEARQIAFIKLSGQVQRKIGLKAIDLGANAVIGYTQCFDLEGDVGVVARGIGTAATLIKINDTLPQPIVDNALLEERTLKYIEFLACNKNNEKLSTSKFDLSDDNDEYVYNAFGIEKKEKPKKSHKMIPERKKKHKKHKEKHKHDLSMKFLLDAEDNRDNPKSFSNKIKFLTSTSKNYVAKKIRAFSKDPNKLTHSYSDLPRKISVGDMSRSSLSDLRGNVNKAIHPKKIERSSSSGCGMTVLLIRSLMSNTDSNLPLHSIVEAHDSPKSSPDNSFLRSTDNKPLSIEQFEKKLRNLSLSKSNYSESSLEKNDFLSGPASSPSTSRTESCSSDYEDEVSEACSDLTTALVEPETVSMVVKYVLAKESESKDEEEEENYYLHPESSSEDEQHLPFITSGTTKILKNAKGKICESQLIQSSSENNLKLMGSYLCSSLDEDNATNNWIGTEPSSAIQFGSTKISKDAKGKILEAHLIHSASENNIGKYLSANDTDDNAKLWIEPGSTAIDEDEENHSRKHDQLLHDFAENMSEKFHHFQEHMHMSHSNEEMMHDIKENIANKLHNLQENMHLIHEKEEIIHHHHNPGLLETAMDTILIDKLNILEAQAGIEEKHSEVVEECIPELKRTESLMQDIKDKFHNIKDHMHIPDGQGIKNKFHSMQKHLHMPHMPHIDSHNNRTMGNIVHHKDEPGLLETAMNTMLIDKLNIIELQSGMKKKDDPNAPSSSLEKSKKRLSFSIDTNIFHRSISSKDSLQQNLSSENEQEFKSIIVSFGGT